MAANNTIAVEFVLRGLHDISRAIRTVEQSAAAADRNREKTASQASKQRTRVEEQEAKAKIRAQLQVDRESKRLQDKQVKDTERGAKQRLKAEEREMRAMVRAAEKAANDRLRIERKVDRDFAAMQKQQHRERDRIIKDDERRQEQHAARIAKIRERSASMAGQFAAKQAQDEIRAKDRFVRGTSSRLMGAGRTVSGVVGRAAGTMAQLGGGFSVADSVEREVGMHRIAGKIAASSMPSADGSKPTTRELVGNARATGLAAGVDPKDILEGIDQFKNLTGETGRAMKMMPDIAKLATAFGADVGELSANAGNIALADPTMSNDDVMRMLRVQTRQGAVGAVELEHMAKYGSRLTAGAGLFEGDRGTNIGTMGAFAQMARQRGGAASPAEAALAAQRFATDVASHADQLKDQGIDVKGKDGKLKDPREILKQMVEKTGGDVTKFKSMNLGERGVKVLTAASDIYSSKGGGKLGMQALDAELKKFTDGVSEAEVEMRARERLQDADKQLECAMIELRSAVGSQLLPEFLKMVPVLREALPTITKLLAGFVTLADWAMRNPLSGLSVMIGAAFAKELAAAAIGKLIETALTSRLGGSALVVGSAIMAIASAKMMIEQEFKEEADAQRNAIGRQAEASNLIAKMNRGEKLSPEEQTKAQDVLAGMRGDVRKQIELRDDPGLGKIASGAMANIVAPEQAEDAANAEERNRQETIKNLSDTMKLLQKAIEQNTTATKGSPGAPGGAATPPVARPAAATNGIVQRTQ